MNEEDKKIVDDIIEDIHRTWKNANSNRYDDTLWSLNTNNEDIRQDDTCTCKCSELECINDSLDSIANSLAMIIKLKVIEMALENKEFSPIYVLNNFEYIDELIKYLNVENDVPDDVIDAVEMFRKSRLDKYFQ